jgi:hypothetical protein
MTVNVTVENQGNFGETFTVSLYGTQTLILKGSTYLPPQNLTTVTVAWNTSGFAKGNYTISVVADPSSETRCSAAITPTNPTSGKPRKIIAPCGMLCRSTMFTSSLKSDPQKP